jgi:hypothetical protein
VSFLKGESGNPAGRKPGSKNRASVGEIRGDQLATIVRKAAEHAQMEIARSPGGA